jgi:hypothetical protein
VSTAPQSKRYSPAELTRHLTERIDRAAKDLAASREPSETLAFTISPDLALSVPTPDGGKETITANAYFHARFVLRGDAEEIHRRSL